MNAISDSVVLASLKKVDISKSLELLREWLVDAQPGEPEQLLRQASPKLRPKLALLLRDLLSRYPATVVGVPVLMYCCHPDPFLEQQVTDDGADQPVYVRLPYPPFAACRPCTDLHFLGWLPLDAQLPIEFPFRVEAYQARLTLNEISTAVALFRTHPGIFDLDELHFPDKWWGDLFQEIPGQVITSSRLVVPYPDALEAARVMYAAARDAAEIPSSSFLSEATRMWAVSAGLLFQETCRHIRENGGGQLPPLPHLSDDLSEDI